MPAPTSFRPAPYLPTNLPRYLRSELAQECISSPIPSSTNVGRSKSCGETCFHFLFDGEFVGLRKPHRKGANGTQQDQHAQNHEGLRIRETRGLEQESGQNRACISARSHDSRYCTDRALVDEGDDSVICAIRH